MRSSPDVEHHALRQRGALCALLMLLLLGGCSSGGKPRLYLLEPPAFQVAAAADSLLPPAREAAGFLGTAEVLLPDYALARGVGTRLDNGELSVAINEQWAETPVMAITRLFAERLQLQSGMQVLIKPWPRDTLPLRRVKLEFHALYRLPDGGAFMSGQVKLLDGAGRELLQLVPFAIRESAAEISMQAYFNALAQGIDAVAVLATQLVGHVME